MISQTHKQIKALAIYQIIGGLLGILLTAWVMFGGTTLINQQNLRMGLFAVLLYIFSIISGRILWRNPRRGLILSLANQVLQVLYFSFGAYGFQYVAGLRIGLGVDMAEGWIFKFRLALSSFHFNLGTELDQRFIGLNLLALFLIFWMERLLEKVKAGSIQK